MLLNTSGWEFPISAIATVASFRVVSREVRRLASISQTSFRPSCNVANKCDSIDEFFKLFIIIVFVLISFLIRL